MSKLKTSKEIDSGIGEKNTFVRYTKALTLVVIGISTFLGAVKVIQDFSFADKLELPPPITAPPTAEFEFPENIGTDPFPVQFSNQSTGDSTTWHWNFGDGETSTTKNPNHTYRKSSGSCFEKKSFIVLLLAKNRLGNDRVEKEIFVQAEVLHSFIGDAQKNSQDSRGDEVHYKASR